MGQRYVNKYKTSISFWKIIGDINLFNVNLALNDLIQEITKGKPENVRIQIVLKAPDGSEPDTKLLSKSDIIEMLTEWVNYLIDYKEFDISDITFQVTAIEIPAGTGRQCNLINTLDDKRSIVQIKNKDTLCLARSVVVALSYHKEILQNVFRNQLSTNEINAINYRKQSPTQINQGTISDNELKYLRQGVKLQDILAKALHRIYNIEIRESGNDFTHVKLIEEKLNIEIQIYNLDTRQIYVGMGKVIKVCLIYSNNHYDVISKLPAFLGTNVRKWEANEKLKCEACKDPTKCNKENKVKCPTCGKVFYGQSCFDNHIKNSKCVDHSYVCQLCFRFLKVKISKREDHRCGEKFCTNCKGWHIGDHKCYMQKKKLKDPREKYIFYDFETTLVSENKHEVNYCVAQYFDGEEYIFGTTDEFCNWVFTKRHKDYTVIAHYGKGYDFQFIQEWLVSHTAIAKPNVILNGQKILQLEVKRGYNIRFIDSISFTLQPLRDFPETFALEELAKGYFPHEFNTSENQNYIGEYPERKYYGYNAMTKNDKEKFDKWYVTTGGKTFNFEEEMYKYCKSDVDILRRGCLKLRELFIQISNIDPFQYMTIASVCHAIYRNEYLPVNTLGVINEMPMENYSIKSIKWLKFMSRNKSVNIIHACNGGEYKLNINGKVYKVDGYCEATNTVYQFHGCFYHGCNKCYNELTVNSTSGAYMYKLLENTTRIDNSIKNAGYNLETIWEHEFDSNKDMKSITLDPRDIVEPPKIRDCFFGGRCEPIRLLHNFQEKNEKGKYIDVVSLYPTVMYYDRYLTVHPIRILTPKTYDWIWFGFVYCKILPPRGSYHPVLPCKQKVKQGHKLLFGLCRSCMQTIDFKCVHNKKIKCNESCIDKQCNSCKSVRKIAEQNCNICYRVRNGECFHSDDERCITGFWCTTEVQQAIDIGYFIQDIYEVWHFENTSTELWKGYIQKFLKIKLETSKFQCSETEYREKARKLGIELEALEYNPGLRFISKICLNSLWGKFGQVPKHRQNKYIDTEVDFYKIINF